MRAFSSLEGLESLEGGGGGSKRLNVGGRWLGPGCLYTFTRRKHASKQNNGVDFHSHALTTTTQPSSQIIPLSEFHRTAS